MSEDRSFGLQAWTNQLMLCVASLFGDLLRRTAPKFRTHVRIDTVTLKKIKNLTHPTPGGLGGYLLLKIFRDVPRPNLARMCG